MGESSPAFSAERFLCPLCFLPLVPSVLRLFLPLCQQNPQIPQIVSRWPRQNGVPKF